MIQKIDYQNATMTQAREEIAKVKDKLAELRSSTKLIAEYDAYLNEMIVFFNGESKAATAGNTRARLETLFGQAYRLELVPQPRGARAEIELPLRRTVA